MAQKKDGLFFKPWKELQELQNRQLHYFITRKLYPFSPYYRRLFDRNNIRPDEIRTVQDLRRIPFVSKADFQDVPGGPAGKSREFILQPSEELIRKYLPKTELVKFALTRLLKGKDFVKERLEREYRPIFLTGTAGTTGQSLASLYTNHDLDNLKIYGRRMIDIIGMKSEDLGVNVFPYAPHLAFWLAIFAGIEGGVFILSTGGGKTIGTEGNLKAIAKVKPQFLIGVPNYVYHLLKEAKKEGMDLGFLRNIILGASRVPEGFKRKLANLLAEMNAPEVKIFGTYGFTEARTAWPECPTAIGVSSGYHTYPDKEIFEVIDPDTGEVKGEGEDGELVYTNIDSRGSSVLRYRTGDIVKGGISYAPCPHCGRTVPRISSNLVRSSNIRTIALSKIKGTLVNFNSLEHILDDHKEIDEWQIEIVKKDNDPYEVDELTLYVSLFKETDREKFSRQLNSDLLSLTEISFNRIVFETHQEIQKRIEVESAVKAKKIADKRP
ncbi:MAG: hypothetical protein AUJ51_13290 [Elusimicrobia bacterium CG1_02_56_21]|nr:MAG: hypothetical protein AUJ51_13290 [Elusimicrobia bacterium CG1_02_56_21]